MVWLNERERSYEDSPPLQPVNVFDLDNDCFVKDAKTAGFALDISDTTDFLIEHDQNNRISDPIAIGVYRMDGKLGQENPKLLSMPGFFTPVGACYEGERSLPMPIAMNIGFGNEAATNATFRHEVFHYLHGDQALNRLYQQEKVRLTTRLGGLATSLTSVSSLPTFFSKNWLYTEKVIEQTTPGVLLGTFLGLAATSLYGAVIARNPHSLLHKLDKEEREANAFARKHKDFNPITLTKNSS